MPNNSADIPIKRKAPTDLEHRRWDLMDKVEERLCVALAEYSNQQGANTDSKILQACAIDLSCAIVSALQEESILTDDQIRFAKALSHELQNSLVPGFRPQYSMEEM